LPPLAFHILLHATVSASAMDCTLNVVSKRCFFFISKHSWAPKRSWKISHGGPWKSWKSPEFFSSERVGTLVWNLVSVCCSWQQCGNTISCSISHVAVGCCEGETDEKSM